MDAKGHDLEPLANPRAEPEYDFKQKDKTTRWQTRRIDKLCPHTHQRTRVTSRCKRLIRKDLESQIDSRELLKRRHPLLFRSNSRLRTSKTPSRRRNLQQMGC